MIKGKAMDELSEILKPSWGSEQWILEGWNQITDEEKKYIQSRIDALFRQGLPLELKHSKLFYIYTFALLAQLEVLAIQIPLKFQHQMPKPELRERLRAQLLDEIFHGLVFTKIVYMLSAPYATPPAYNENIEHVCNFIRKEECPKVAVVLLNLIGEGWIEEIFYSLKRQGVAPQVFDTIIEDEHRHVCEADLYQAIGLPDSGMMKDKLAYLEDQLLTNIFLQYKYMFSISNLLGVNGTIEFLQSLNKKHQHQLEKINLNPSENWHFFMKMASDIFPKIQNYAHSNPEIEMTPTRKVFMTQWDNPSDPTMTGEFNINVSCLDFFNKKFPPETITLLMAQTISLGLSENPGFRNYLSHKRLYQSKESYVGLVVKLPDCADQLSTIVFENCHLMSFQALASRVRQVMKMMVYCFKKREYLEQNHPHLSSIFNDMLYDFANDLYDYPIPGNSVISLTNIGFCGYTQTKSPLRVNEVMKFTLLEVERRPVWNHEKQAFEPQDMLPVSISADHRVFDGNLPIPKITATYFEKTFSNMLQEFNHSQNRPAQAMETHLSQALEQLIERNLEAGFKALVLLQTYWVDFFEIEELINKAFKAGTKEASVSP